MTQRINANTLQLVKAIAENRLNAKGRRAAIDMTTDQAIAICSALSDLWEVASTAEVLAKDTLEHLESGEADAHRMRIHAHNIIDEMKALAGEPSEGI